MRKPKGVSCRDCRGWWWYTRSCQRHTYDDDLGLDPTSPDNIEDCEYFEIKTHSEDESVRYTHDKLPSLETVELVKAIRLSEYDDLVRRIKEG